VQVLASKEQQNPFATHTNSQVRPRKSPCHCLYIKSKRVSSFCFSFLTNKIIIIKIKIKVTLNIETSQYASNTQAVIKNVQILTIYFYFIFLSPYYCLRILVQENKEKNK
jgi:hypothetical protein